MLLPSPSGVVTLLTDFGHRDPYVGVMTGAVLRRNRRANVVDLCHEVPSQDVEVAGLFLASALGRFPDGTVHVAVVDPGVGTGRRILLACADNCFWLAPDNGLLTPVLGTADVCELRAVDLEALGMWPVSRTFHGRDLFAPLAGGLSSGQFGFRALGPLWPDPVRMSTDHASRVVLADAFGNLITNVPAACVGPGTVGIEVAGRIAPLRGTYGDVQPGELLALVNSYDLVEIAVAQGDARQALGVDRGEPVAIVTEERGT